MSLIYLIHINHFFTPEMKYEIRGNVRSEKCHSGNNMSAKCPFGELSIRGTVRWRTFRLPEDCDHHDSIWPVLKFIEVNLDLFLICSYEIVLKKLVYLPCNSRFLLLKLLYLWIIYEFTLKKKLMLNNVHIIICWIFLGWTFHVDAGKWYLSKQLRKHYVLGSVSCWLSSCFITCVLC